MKFVTSFYLILLCVVSFFSTNLVAQTAIPPSNIGEAGAGTVSNPFLIETWENFYWITQNSSEWNKHYKQVSDIDFTDAPTDIETWDSNQGLLPIGNNTNRFSGVYDGQEFSIRGVYINRPAISHVGLFGFVSALARVQNLKVYGSITGRDAVGGIAGIVVEGTIQKVFFEGSVVASITNGNALVGGIVGYSQQTTISQAGAIVTLSSVHDYIGGITGYCDRCVVEDSYVRGEITGRAHIGGLVAANTAGSTLRRSYVSASITATNGSASRITTTTTVSAEYLFVNSEKTLSAATPISSPGTTLLTEAQLQDASFLEGFNFFDTWAIVSTENDGFPYLRFERYTPVQVSIFSMAEAPPNFDATTVNRSNPLHIYNWKHLLWINAPDAFVPYPNRNFRYTLTYHQMNDIDFAQMPEPLQDWFDGRGWLPIGSESQVFAGVYNGNGYTIKNLYINRPNETHLGLFGKVGGTTTTITGHISNLNVTGEITGHSIIGGIAGQLDSRVIINDTAIRVNAENVSFTGDITATGTGNVLVGGIVGSSNIARIENSFAKVNFTVTNGGAYLGGISGFQDSGRITEAYAISHFDGGNFLGGIAGGDQRSTPNLANTLIRDVYSSVSFANIAQFSTIGPISTTLGVGYTRAYFNNEHGATFTVLGTAVGLTEAQMRESSNFADFDFENVWTITSSLNNGFPTLRWENYGAETEISGLAGWYMLSLPMADVPFSQLATQNQVQGTTQSELLYGNPIYGSSAAPNLFLYDGEHQNFDPVTSLTVTPESGRGFIWYLFDNDIGPSVTLPFTLQVFGSYQDEQSVSVFIDQGWNLLGNPYTLPITISHGALNQAAGSGLVSSAAQIWTPDPAIANGGSWRLENDEILPFQGFFIENDSATELTFETLMQNTSGNSVLMNTSEKVYIDFELLTETTRDISARILFHEDATDEWDVFDASKLVPLHSQWATVSFGGYRGEAYVQKAQESRPLHFGGELRIPVYIQTRNTTGKATLRWNELTDIPENWDVFLLDTEHGETIAMRTETEFRFALPSDSEWNARSGKVEFQAQRMESPAKSRFELVIVPFSVTSTEMMLDLPSELALSQNFPNPFNPTTQIQFGLPENGMVRLDVYDVLGRRVSTLLQQEMSAGTHQITFDASHLSSGMYVYRLQAGTHTLTRTMTLVK